MVRLEGLELEAYDCPDKFRTVGIGFNMQQKGAKYIWQKCFVTEDFQKVYDQKIEISENSAKRLFNYQFNYSVKKASRRAKKINVNYENLPEWHKFILADIHFNTGSVANWKKVFIETEPKKVLFEARRHPEELMDSRVYKIGKWFNIVQNKQEAIDIGIKYP